MKVNGLMTKQMDGVYIFIKTGQDMKEIGSMINKKERVEKYGLMDRYLLENLEMEKKTEEEDLNGVMDLNLKENW
jgi:hypothetical protein